MPLPLSDRRLTRRFRLLWMMAHTHGACWSCAQWYAWAQLELEFTFATPRDDTRCAWMDECEERMRRSYWPYVIDEAKAA